MQLIDLFPTLLESADAAIPATAGRSLVGLMNGTRLSRPAMSEIVGSQYAVRDEGFKLIQSTSGAVQLFDLARDPYETRDVATANPVRVDRLRSMLRRMHADALKSGRDTRTETVPVDPTAADRLRALGYVQR